MIDDFMMDPPFVPFDVFEVLERNLLPPKKKAKKSVPVEQQNSVPLPTKEVSELVKTDPVESADDVLFVSDVPNIKCEFIEPKVEKTSDGSESEGEQYEDDIIWTILNDWRLEKELGPIFTKYKICLEVMKNLTNDDLKIMVPDEDLAIRVLFRTNLQKWQKANGYGIFEGHPSPSDNKHFAVGRPPFKRSRRAELLTKDLESILKTTIKGRHVLEYRFLNFKETLPANYRLILCEAIVEYCTEQKYLMKKVHFDYLSSEIVRLFKTEIKDVYYTPTFLNEPLCGWLVDEYNKSCKKLGKSCLRSSKFRSRKRPASSRQQAEVELSDEQNEAVKLWLWGITDPWCEPITVLSRWKKTFLFRRQGFMNSTKKQPVINQWPILRHKLGYTLIESDFDQLYPGKSNAMFEKWDDFNKRILPIFKSDIQNSLGNRLFANYSSLGNQDVKNCICFQLLNSVVAPTEIIHLKMITSEGKQKTNTWKPSIRDASTSFFNLVNSAEHATKLAEVMRKRYIQVGLVAQPLVFGIGYKDEDIEEFIVIYHNIQYSVNSFLKAMNIIFKLYHVFNLEYNKESQLMWVFIQRYFFDIVKEDDKNSDELSRLLERLK